MVDPTPDALAAGYDGVIRHGGVFDVDGPTFERVRSRADRWGVGAFVHDGDRVLLVAEDGRWFLPGGARQPGECLPAGAAREVREETGVTVRVDTLAAISEQTFRYDGDEVAYHFATFEARPETTALADDPGLPAEGIERVAWWSEIPEDTFDRELVSRLAASRGI